MTGPVSVGVIGPEQQRAIVDKIYDEGLNKGDLSIADEYLTPDFRNHGSHDDSLTGPEAFKNTIRKQRSGFSDVRYEILDFLSQGDKAMVRWVMHGRHTGEFLGVPPTGKIVQHHAIIILRFEGAKIAERWGIVDNFTLLRQLRPGGPVGRWSGKVTYEGKVDEFTVVFNENGTVALDTVDSDGTGTWTATGPEAFRFAVKEVFKRDASGATPAKVIPGAAYIQIEMAATLSGPSFAGSGTAQIRAADDSVIHSTTAEMAAQRSAAG